MATYKVIQDIEAEDKLLGPMTLRQFIYAIIVAVSGFIAFKLAFVAWYLALPFLPGMVLFAVLAAPFGHDQPSEVWLLAKIRFALKPRIRIWNQSGIKELVTVTAPKHIEKFYSDGLSQTEVKSRLRALADTIDSRGWAVKNVNVSMGLQPSFAAPSAASDRLVDGSNLPQEVPNYDVVASDDMLDTRSNPAAHQLDQLMNSAAQAHRQQVVANMQHPAANAGASTATNDYWFMRQAQASQLPQPGMAAFGATPLVSPGATSDDGAQPNADEQAFARQLQAQKTGAAPAYGHTKVITPLGQQPATPPPVTAQPEPAILELANNDDFNVATIAREAERTRRKPSSDNEVVVSLH